MPSALVFISGYHNVTDRQTDRRTAYDSNTALALRASSGSNNNTQLTRQENQAYRSSVLWKFWKLPRIIWSATSNDPHMTANIMSGFSA